MCPEYLATADAFVTKDHDQGQLRSRGDDEGAAGRVHAQEHHRARLRPAVDTNGFVVTKATADKYKLAKMSDLRAVAEELVLGGPPECPQRPFCLHGPAETYGAGVQGLQAARRRRSADRGRAGQRRRSTSACCSRPTRTSRSRTTCCSKTTSTCSWPTTSRRWCATRSCEQGAGYSRTLLNGVSSKLTTAELTDMNKQVGIDHKDAKDVAKAYLKSKGLIK